MKKKINIALGAISGILLIVFNVLVFLIFSEKNEVFWLSYAFVTVAFAAQFISMFMSFRSADVETAFFGIPLVSFSIYYLCATLVIGIIFMIFQNAGFTLALIIQLLVFVAFLIIAIISILSRDVVKAVNDNVKSKVVEHKSHLVDIEMIRESCTDAELKEALRKLSETVKYSDPMSNDSIADVEKRIMQKISELRVNTEDGLTEDAKKNCSELERLYIERNKKLAISK